MKKTSKKTVKRTIEEMVRQVRIEVIPKMSDEELADHVKRAKADSTRPFDEAVRAEALARFVKRTGG